MTIDIIYSENRMRKSLKSVNHLNGNEDIEYFAVNPFEHEKMGMYVDVNCEQGKTFLKKCSLQYMFTNNYSWLLWVSNLTEVLMFLEDLNISIDSDVTVVLPNFDLYETYKVHYKKPVISNLLLNWSESDGIKSVNPPSDRENLRGLKLPISYLLMGLPVHQNSTMEDFMDSTLEPDVFKIGRVSYRIVNHLKDCLNISYEYIHHDSWGYVTESGNYSGGFGALERGDCEASASLASVLEDRIDTFDIFQETKSFRLGFSFLQPRAFGLPNSLIIPYETEVWIYFIILTIILMIIYQIFGKFDETPDISSWGATIVYVFGAITQQGFEDTLKLSASRILNLTLLIMTFIVCVYYNAAVLNGLLSPSPNTILTIEQLIDSNIKVRLLDSPYNKDRISKVTVFGEDGPLRQLLYKHFSTIPDRKLYFSIEEGVEHLKKGKLALFSILDALYPFLISTLTDAEMCSLYHLYTVPPVPGGLYLRNNSPYTELFRQSTTRMNQEGLVKRVYLEWYQDRPVCKWRLEAKSIGTEALIVAYAFLLLGMILSLVQLVIEIFREKRTAKK